MTTNRTAGLNDSDGDRIEYTNGYGGICVTAIVRDTMDVDGEELCVGPFTADDLRSTLDEIAPKGRDWSSGAGSSFPSPKKGLRYQRERDDAHAMAALWKETARRAIQSNAFLDSAAAMEQQMAMSESLVAAEAIKRAEQTEDTLLLVRQQRDQATERAEKAEKERDNKAAAYEQLKFLFGSAERAALRWKVRAAQPHPLTAREHLDAAWEAAHVPEGDFIPKGAWAIQREPGGQILTAYAKNDNVRARDPFAPQMERRLLDPPAPSRPKGAEDVESQIEAWDQGYGDDAIMTAPRLRELADYLAERGVRVTGDAS